jgi:hypothetical protein
VVVLVACLIVGARLVTAEATFHLAIIAASAVMAASMALAAVITMTGRNLW